MDVNKLAYLVERKISPGHHFTGASRDPDEWNNKVEDLKLEVQILKSKSSEVISFHQLVFRGPKEADAWVEEHCPGARYGLVIDFHTTMEHIFKKIKRIDALLRMEKVHKIHGSNSEAVAIASFEVMVPRFFTKPSDHKVYEDTESYFSNIKSQQKWDNPSSGHKLILEQHMERFQQAHMSVIRKRLRSTSRMYHVAVAALSSTVAWVSRFFAYVNNTFKTHTDGIFGQAKVWHITTKLATTLLLEMAKPRESTFDSLEASTDSSLINARESILQYLNIIGCDARNKQLQLFRSSVSFSRISEVFITSYISRSG